MRSHTLRLVLVLGMATILTPLQPAPRQTTTHKAKSSLNSTYQKTLETYEQLDVIKDNIKPIYDHFFKLQHSADFNISLDEAATVITVLNKASGPINEALNTIVLQCKAYATASQQYYVMLSGKVLPLSHLPIITMMKYKPRNGRTPEDLKANVRRALMVLAHVVNLFAVHMDGKGALSKAMCHEQIKQIHEKLTGALVTSATVEQASTQIQNLFAQAVDIEEMGTLLNNTIKDFVSAVDIYRTCKATK